MKTVSNMECDRMFTFEIVLENRRGEKRTFTEATKYIHGDDGTKTLHYYPEQPDPDVEAWVQASQEFGLDWKVVEITGMNVPEEAQSV